MGVSIGGDGAHAAERRRSERSGFLPFLPAAARKRRTRSTSPALIYVTPSSSECFTVRPCAPWAAARSSSSNAVLQQQRIVFLTAL